MLFIYARWQFYKSISCSINKGLFFTLIYLYLFIFLFTFLQNNSEMISQIFSQVIHCKKKKKMQCI